MVPGPALPTAGARPKAGCPHRFRHKTLGSLMFWVVDNFLMRKGRTKAKLEERGANQDPRNGSKVRYRRAASHEESESEVLISADDEMEESDVEEGLHRLSPLKPVKKKHRFGLPV